MRSWVCGIERLGLYRAARKSKMRMGVLIFCILLSCSACVHLPPEILAELTPVGEGHPNNFALRAMGSEAEKVTSLSCVEAQC